MEYTPAERLARLWELVRKDPDGMECQEEMQGFERRLAEFTDPLPVEERLLLWALPVTQHTYFNRIPEVVSRHLRLPKEGENHADH